MSSGPANVAIYSRSPYLIFKNPGHHKNKMDAELGKNDYFSFALECQKFFREKESLARLKWGLGMILNKSI